MAKNLSTIKLIRIQILVLEQSFKLVLLWHKIRINLIYTDGIYTITVGYMTHMQNLNFKLNFGLCVVHLIVKVYTLSVYSK